MVPEPLAVCGKGALLALLSGLLLGCSSTGNVGLLTRGSADPSSLLRNPQAYESIGAVRGRSCRYFLLNLIPWGDATSAAAMEHALAGNGGDAILNASITTSLYGFIPLYNIFQLTCTTVSGTGVRFIESENAASPPPDRPMPRNEPRTNPYFDESAEQPSAEPGARE